MKKQILFGAAGLVLGAIAISAQNNAEFQLFSVPPLGVEGFSGKVVDGKPFSATEERHTIQTLGDGTRIENNETNRLFRDEQGRTRVERSNGTVNISDPVAGFTARLDSVNRTANRTNNAGAGLLGGLRMDLPAVYSPITAAQSDKSQAESAALQNTFGGRGGRGGSGGRGVAFAGSGAAGRSITFSSDAGPLVVFEGLSRQVAGGDNAITMNIPAQLVNGVMAQGTRITQIIPTGKIGNDRPITVVNERWFSNDLQMLVKSTSSDPRFGDTTYQLTNIVQSAPDPWLFQIPADYTIRK